MKRALPTNSIELIRGEAMGMKRLSNRPAKKAPSTGSRPIICAVHAARKTSASTKTYWVTLSLYFLKKYRVTRGKRYSSAATHIAKRNISSAMATKLKNPSCRTLTVAARTSRAPITAMMVPTIAMSTAGALVMPKRAATG